jgi:hypothetical protein
MPKNVNPNPARKHTWRAPSGLNYPLVDLEYGTSVLIQPTEEDVACAIKRDIHNCALAQAWKRQTDVPDAQIGTQISYLPMRRNGKLIALRCRTRPETLVAIDNFDRTDEFPSEGFKFDGIIPSNKIDSQRAEQKRFRERWHNKKNITGRKNKKLHLRNASRGAQVVVE